MGWRIHRVWSTEWFNDRNRAIQAVLTSLQQAEERPLEESIQATPLPQTPVEQVLPSEIALAEQLSPPLSRRYLGGVPYRKYQETADRDLLIRPRRKAELAATVTAIVETEGPIHEDFLHVRLKEICGIDRAGSNVQSNITDAIYLAIRDQSIERRQQDFLGSRGSQLPDSDSGTITSRAYPVDSPRRNCTSSTVLGRRSIRNVSFGLSEGNREIVRFVSSAGGCG